MRQDDAEQIFHEPLIFYKSEIFRNITHMKRTLTNLPLLIIIVFRFLAITYRLGL